ncbi:EEF1A lysine methyltransferase 3-like [Rhincodon typus]|uniref:EEF1A lysine methyltransferase 3-like n=1 Tax=Rhincodon typus TaxID=259920 RepID=UPI002030A355|nr:EEF1A lysine methyltransferase 3-like [Rhincodon typus]
MDSTRELSKLDCRVRNFLELKSISQRSETQRGSSGSRKTAEHMEKSCSVLSEEDPEDNVPCVLVKHYQFCGYDLEITRYFNERMGVSAFVWNSGLTLCQFFEQERMNFSGKKMIELGSGTGIVGILAILLGGQVTLTDQIQALKQIEHNVSVNVPDSCRHLPTIRALSWGFDHVHFPSDYDIILGSDIVYYPSDFPLLLQTLRHLSNQQTIIYIATELRGCGATRKFHEELIPLYFNSRIIYRNKDADINLYKLTLKGPKTGEEKETGKKITV